MIICLFSLTTLQNTLYNNDQRPTVPSSNIRENIIMNTHTPGYSIYMLKDLNAQYLVKWRGSRAVFFVWYTHHRKNVFRAQLYASWVCRILGYFVQQGKLADLNTVKTIIYVTKVVFVDLSILAFIFIFSNSLSLYTLRDINSSFIINMSLKTNNWTFTAIASPPHDVFHYRCMTCTSKL